MNKKILVAIALTLALVMSLSSCSFLSNLWESYVSPIFKGPTVELTDAPLNAEKIVDFTQEVDPSILFESDGWSNGDVFNVVWKKHNVAYENGIMRLGITEEKVTTWLNDEEVEFNYTAGEARTQNYYHYGDYEVSMKPSANPGTASTFFVCTGPYDTKFVLDENGDYVLDENGQRTSVPNAHDEIDIEFLGKDTTKVQFNFFVGGQGGNEYMYDLGFDASKEFHRYGFRWAEDSITWFVDGVPVYKVTTNKNATTGNNLRVVEKLPSTAGRMLTNYWCGNERAWGWMGEYKGAVNDNGTEYQWIATSAEGAPLNPVETPETDNTDINWAEITPVAPTFASTELYTVAIEGNKANVTYTAVGGSDYKNVEMNIADAAAGKNYVYLKVTNNGTETVNVRVNVVDQALVDAGAQNMATNVSATMNGAAVNTDLVWGGSFFDILAGETAELVVKFGGEVELLQLMIDSSKNDATVRSGDITVEDIKFATFGEITPPEENNPVTPPTDDEGLQFTFWTSDATYTTVGNQIKYNGAGNTYACAGTDIATLAQGNDTFTVTITNNGTADSRVRLDIQATTEVGNHKACNVSATGGDVWTDAEWGGSTVTVAAGQSVTLVITYNGASERGAVTNLVVFVDSARGDANNYTADITLSGMTFSKVGTSEPTDPVDPVVPVLPELPTDGEYVKFVTENAYTIVADAEYVNKVQITYSAISTNTWNNVNTYIADKAAGKNNLNVTLRNNGTAPVLVSVKLEAAGATELAFQKVELAAGELKTVSLDFAGVAEMLYFFIDSDWSETNTTHAGDISIAGIKFSGEAAPAAPVLPNDGEYVKLTGNDCYTITAEAEYSNTVRVSYTNVATNSYQNVNTWVQDKSTGKTSFSVTLLNNGTEAVRITVKLEKETNGPAKENTVELAAGEMKTVILEYTEEGVMLYFFIGSGWSETTTTGSGDVTIAGIKFQ